MQTQESNLLRVPREIRILILRELLFRPSSSCIHGVRKNGLHVQILGTNKQMYYEGLEILYGENYFRINIRNSREEGKANFMNCHRFVEEIQWKFPRFKLIQHYEIYVEIQEDKDRSTVKSIVRKVAEVLAEIPRIKHLRIILGGYEPYKYFFRHREEVYTCSDVLQPFVLLREVNRVDLRGGVRPQYAEYLQNMMEGKSLLDHLPKMYDALERLASPFEEFQQGLLMIRVALEDYDVPEFKRIHSDLSRQVIDRIQHAFNHLTDHDAEPDEEGKLILPLSHPV